MIKYLIKQTIKFILHIFWLLPISKKKIFFSSFKGTTISCNPYYICEELLKRNSDFKIVWCCNNPESFNPFNEQDVTFVKFNSLKYIIELMTSHILVNNASFPTWIPFRLKKQVLIDTWHGGGAYKKVAASEINTKEVVKRERISARNTSYFISSSRIFTDVMKGSTFVEEWKFLPIGMPRNDIFFNKEKYLKTADKVRIDCSFNKEDFLVLYAPTYRGSSLNSTSFDTELDTEKLRSAIKLKYGKNPIIAYRGHYFNSENGNHSFDRDLSSFPNMQELLCAADMLITDYSSSMWDFSLTGKPCILYCPDINQYKKDRGFYTEPETWGFSIAENNDELKLAIENFNQNEYESAVKKNHEYFGSYEKGHASEAIVDKILQLF